MIRILALLALLTAGASAQELLHPASPRHFTVDGRLYARQTAGDSLVLVTLKAGTAIKRVYIIPEDTLWMMSPAVTIATEYGEILTWTSETVGLNECLGCLAADWPQTFGDLIYRKSAQTVVARFPGFTGDVRGTMYIVIDYIELY